ncbi:MAG TPA: helix-turn-helix domain-containing protein [Acidimicrobiales bacterium]|nr:helix-turn-helix domain-containing protein [Acidimicrobiales bacterium]
MPEADLPRPVAPRLAVLKALGDNTRYAIYLELARSPRPLATAEIADTLGLHPNTVRPHLERMRDVGLLDIETDARGAVGRPQHRYSLAADAPSLGLEPATFPVLARMLLRVAATGGLGAEEAVEAGRDQGLADGEAACAADATRAPDPAGDAVACLESLMSRLDALGFDPAVAVDAEDTATVAFTHCPFRELAETHPEIVCSLHQGMVEGFVAAAGGAAVNVFHPLTDRTPCQVDLALSLS